MKLQALPGRPESGVGVELAVHRDRRTRRSEWRRPKEPWTQLATRIPKELHRRLKLYRVTHDIALMHFVVAAIEEKLGRKAKPKNRG